MLRIITPTFIIEPKKVKLWFVGVNKYITIAYNNNMINNVVLNCRGGRAFLAS
jgi:hypothetical protein